jgi:hypothetical protein
VVGDLVRIVVADRRLEFLDLPFQAIALLAGLPEVALDRLNAFLLLVPGAPCLR